MNQVLNRKLNKVQQVASLYGLKSFVEDHLIFGAYVLIKHVR